jgi:transcriptional regulator GlxA family with amidase domain
VAFAIGPETQILDFTGPWEVFQGVHLETGDSRQHGEAQARHQEMDSSMPFRPYAVSDTTEPVEISGGLRVLPKYSFETAPQPEIVVVPAQDHHGRAPGIFDWLRRVSATADLILSVCNGSWLLAKAGLLSGRAATCHHASYDQMARRFPDVDVRRNVRFVEGPGIATAGGNSAGIDLALRVVERYFGREAAQRQADSMEYQGTGWLL